MRFNTTSGKLGGKSYGPQRGKNVWSCIRHLLKAETVYLKVLNIRLFTCIPQELVNYLTYLSCGGKNFRSFFPF